MRSHAKKILILLSSSGLIMSSQMVNAAGFQLWEQDGATVGNYHAGRAAEAADASTSFYNPAGLVRIHNQQIVGSIDPVMTNFVYRGSVYVNTSGIASGPQSTVAQGGHFNVVPGLHYAAPLAENLVFGFSVVSPFGLETNYDKKTYAQYASTRTSLTVIDVSPSLGFAINNHLSVGAGFDAEHARGEFDLVAGVPVYKEQLNVNNDTTSTNVGNSWGYGYHLGALYQFSEMTRLGISYHSKISQHLRGTSKFEGQLANGTYGGLQESRDLKANTTFPATTTLSFFHTVNPTWDWMGTVIYTQWSVLNELNLQNTAGIVTDETADLAPSNNINVNVLENYRNTWNFSVGTNYHVNEAVMLRAGLGYDQTPSRNAERNLQLPDSNRIAVALGTHYQLSKTLGFDVGWTHFFVQNAGIHNLTQSVGAQTTTLDGKVSSEADVFGFQMKWDIV